MRTPALGLAVLIRMTGIAAPLLVPAFEAHAQPARLSMRGGLPAAEASIVKRLPAGRDELVFRGESSVRSFEVFLTPFEALHISTFQLGLLNAIVAFPDRSSLKLTINGRAVGVVPVGSSDKVRRSTVRVGPGVLTAGYNRVRVEVSMTHRVDCSVNATYELWAQLDPAQTGFLTTPTATPIRSLEDLRSEPLGEDGATHIRARMPEDASPETIARYAQLVQAVVRRSRAPRPLVDVGADAGEGPGFDVVLSSDGKLPGGEKPISVGREGDLQFLRDAHTNRLTVMLTALDDDVGARLDEIARGGEPAAAVSFDSVSRSFADLGFYTEPFAGRRYLSTVNVELPGDFFSANYDKVQVLLDGSHSGSLDRDSVLIFRVNGKVAASLPLATGRPEAFAHKQISLPLSDFRPGHNEITIEGLLPSPVDQQCDAAVGSHETRLELLPSSELRFPRLARMATLPRISSAIEARADGGSATPVYIANADFASLGTALTALANLGLYRGFGSAPELHFNAPVAGDPPGVVIAPASALPVELSDELGKLARPAEAASADPALAEADPTPAPAPLQKPAPLVSLDRLIGRGDAADPLTLSSNYLLIGALPKDSLSSTEAVQWPRFGDAATQWLVVASSSPEAEKAGIARFTANGGWSQLSGQAVAYDADSGEIKSVEPSKVAYAQPARLNPADLRPILGGVFSDNIALSFGLFIGLVGLLGLSTHALVRKSGVRK